MLKEKKTQLEVKKAILKMKNNKFREIKMESRIAKRRRRWDDRKSNSNIQQIWGRRTDTVTMERDIIKPLYKGGGSKEKNQESQRGIFTANIVSKAYEIVKKIQNEAIQSNMCKMQTGWKKNRSTMDNIIIMNVIIEKQRQSHKNTYLFFANAEKFLDKLWLKDCLIEME